MQTRKRPTDKKFGTRYQDCCHITTVMRLLCLPLLAFVVTYANPAQASIAPSALRLVLRRAAPAIRACQDVHSLPSGRYTVRLTIDPSGKVEAVVLTAAPERMSRSAETCLRGSYFQLQFRSRRRCLARDPMPSAPSHGRRSRVPGPLRPPRGCGTITIHYPFVLADAREVP